MPGILDDIKDRMIDVWRRAPTLVIVSGIGLVLLCTTCCLCGGCLAGFVGSNDTPGEDGSTDNPRSRQLAERDNDSENGKSRIAARDESSPDTESQSKVTLDTGRVDATEPLDISQPDESQPDESQPDESQPDESHPDESQPDESPVRHAPVVTKPRIIPSSFTFDSNSHFVTRLWLKDAIDRYEVAKKTDNYFLKKKALMEYMKRMASMEKKKIAWRSFVQEISEGSVKINQQLEYHRLVSEDGIQLVIGEDISAEEAETISSGEWVTITGTIACVWTTEGDLFINGWTGEGWQFESGLPQKKRRIEDEGQKYWRWFSGRDARFSKICNWSDESKFPTRDFEEANIEIVNVKVIRDRLPTTDRKPYWFFPNSIHRTVEAATIRIQEAVMQNATDELKSEVRLLEGQRINWPISVGDKRDTIELESGTSGPSWMSNDVRRRIREDPCLYVALSSIRNVHDQLIAHGDELKIGEHVPAIEAELIEFGDRIQLEATIVQAGYDGSLDIYLQLTDARVTGICDRPQGFK